MRTQSGRQGLVGSAAAGPGQFGEILPFGLLAAAAVSLTNNVAKTIASRVLGPGTYLCIGFIGFNPTNALTTVGYMWAAISETDNSQGAADDFGPGGIGLPPGDPGLGILSFKHGFHICTVPQGQTKTVYLVARSSFDQTMTAYGQAIAVRI